MMRASILILAILLATGPAHANQKRGSSPETLGQPSSVGEATSPAMGNRATLRLIAAIGSSAEDLFDFAADRRWQRATVESGAIRRQLHRLKAARVADTTAVFATADTIDQAINHRDDRTLLHAANQMTRLVAELSRPFHPIPPVEIALLDYEGREVTLWSSEKNIEQVNATKRALANTWQRVRPHVLAHDGSAAARRFDALVERLRKAAAFAEITAAAGAVLDEVDVLESLPWEQERP